MGDNVVVELNTRLEGGAIELIPDMAAVEKVVALTLAGVPDPVPLVAVTWMLYVVD